MAIEQTLSILKPDAVGNRHMGEIILEFEKNDFNIAAAKLVHLTKEQAEGFYGEHKERPFFNDLVQFMTSGPVMLMVLQGENAIARNREIMGATNPQEAAEGTLRNRFSKSIDANTVHGSDSADSARREVKFFFDSNEIVNLKK